MIYDNNIPSTLEQGDICHNLPKISADQAFSSTSNDDIHSSNFWEDFSQSGSSGQKKEWQLSIIPIFTRGIILSQTCDLRPGASVLFAEIRENPDPLSQKGTARYKQIHKQSV